MCSVFRMDLYENVPLLTGPCMMNVLKDFFLKCKEIFQVGKLRAECMCVCDSR